MAEGRYDGFPSKRKSDEPIDRQYQKRRRRRGRNEKSETRRDQANIALCLAVTLFPAMAGLRCVEGRSPSRRFSMGTSTNRTQTIVRFWGDHPFETDTPNTWSNRDISSFSPGGILDSHSVTEPTHAVIDLDDVVVRNVNIMSKRNEIYSDSNVIDAVFNPFSANRSSDSESPHPEPIPQIRQNRPLYNPHTPPYSVRPRLVIELDTSCSNGDIGDNRGNRMKGRIRSRIENRGWNKMPHLQRTDFRGPTLSISLDAFAPSPSQHDNIHEHVQHDDGNAIDHTHNNINHPDHRNTTPKHHHQHHRPNDSLLDSLLLPITQTTSTLLTQTALLIPPLILSRRILNSTWNALVDYFRGRYFRTTFTRLERAYLRYYEFPAVTRAVWRTVSQMGILMGLSWLVRWWMIVALAGNGVGGPMMWMLWGGAGGLGVNGGGGGGGLDSSSSWNVGLPCQSQTTGVAMVCALVWIGAVVGTGHACAMVVSRPLSLNLFSPRDVELSSPLVGSTCFL